MTELFNPHSNEWLLNKFEIYKTLRSMPAAYWSEKYQMYVITRYDDVIYALSNPDIFSSAKGNLICEEEKRFGNTLGASDNPVHDTYKKIVKEAYSKNNIERVMSIMSEKAKDMLTGITTVNMSEIIEHLSAWTIAEIINIPYNKEKVKNLIFEIQRKDPLAVYSNTDETASKRLLETIITLSRIAKRPAEGPGIYNEFMTNNPEDLTVMSLFMGPTLSGASSMTSALEFLVLDLYRTGTLSAVYEDRKLIQNAVDESLRYHASTGRFSRTVIKETTLHGVEMKPGDRVALCLDSANRDPSMFQNPDVFDLHRNSARHLAFGHGVHACIALAISKSAMCAFLDVLLDTVGMYKILTPNEDLLYVMTASGNNDMISNILLEKQ